MSYTANTPRPNQSLGNSQPQINNNFTIFEKIFDIDHVDFDEEQGDMGKHVSQRFPFAASASQATTAAGEIAYYQKQVSAIARLFFREPSNGTEQQWSGKVFQQKGAKKRGGFVPLFGGISLAFGFVATVPQTPLAITFNAECGAQFTTNAVVVYAVGSNLPKNASPIVTVTAVTNAGCTIGTTAAKNVYFMAIGI